MPKTDSDRAKEYTERYSIGVIERNSRLSDYNRFLANQGESASIEDLVSKLLLKKKKIRIFEIGAGTGDALAELKKRFGKKVECIGIDLLLISDKTIDRRMEGDALQADFPAGCDLVFSFRALHEVGSVSEIIPKVCECLSENGLGLLSFRVSDWVNNKKIFRGEMTPKDEEYLTRLATEGQFCEIEKKIFPHMQNPEVLSGVFVKMRKRRTRGLSVRK